MYSKRRCADPQERSKIHGALLHSTIHPYRLFPDHRVSLWQEMLMRSTEISRGTRYLCENNKWICNFLLEIPSSFPSWIKLIIALMQQYTKNYTESGLIEISYRFLLKTLPIPFKLLHTRFQNNRSFSTILFIVQERSCLMRCTKMLLK